MPQLLLQQHLYFVMLSGNRPEMDLTGSGVFFNRDGCEFEVVQVQHFSTDGPCKMDLSSLNECESADLAPDNASWWVYPVSG